MNIGKIDDSGLLLINDRCLQIRPATEIAMVVLCVISGYLSDGGTARCFRFHPYSRLRRFRMYAHDRSGGAKVWLPPTWVILARPLALAFCRTTAPRNFTFGFSARHRFTQSKSSLAASWSMSATSCR